MELPIDLRIAIEQELKSISTQELAKVVTKLSNRYRGGRASEGVSFVTSTDEATAYAAFRLPATYAAIYSVLKEVKTKFPDWCPETLLDVGAGPGPVMWAANESELWPHSFRQITLLEREPAMMALGKRLASYAPKAPIREAQWYLVDVTRRWPTVPHDLVVTSYVLGELSLDSQEAFLAQLWEMTNHTLVIIEPGTPVGFACVKEAREKLLALGGKIVAPCPHDNQCPIAGDDWCHFAQRVTRSRLHRQAKAGELGYEDEKFSYIAISREQAVETQSRVLRHPQTRKGHIRLQLCTPEGITGTVVTRKNRALFRKARDLRWGSSFDYWQPSSNDPDDQ